MIDLYFWPTPNGNKITLFLEETGLPYKIIPVNISKGDQFEPNFLQISPNNKMPAIIDHAPLDKGAPISVFESGAILLYLAEKTGKLLSTQVRERAKTLEWLFWQVAGLGPMLGQSHHFTRFAPINIPYAIERYEKETSRLCAVLNKQLSKSEYISGAYSIADIACYPWIVSYEKQYHDLQNYPQLNRWFYLVQQRPAVQRAYAIANEFKTESLTSPEARRNLFGQDKNLVKKD